MDTEDAYGVEMTDDEIAAFLSGQGHGVLAVARDDLPYGIPVSFGYDGDENRFVLQLLFGSDSQKRRFIEEGDPVTLVTYEWNTPYDWRSVIAQGVLRSLPTDEQVAAAETFAPEAKTVSLAVFMEPVEELEAAWYEIDVDRITGRETPTENAEEE